jgi:hypothetical protein
MMSLGTKLTCYLLLGVLVVMGLELYLSVTRIQTDLLHNVRREVVAISRTLHLALTVIDRTDIPESHFKSFVASLSHFENMLDVVFYGNRSGCENLSLAITSPSSVPYRHGNTGSINTRHLGAAPSRNAGLYWGA